MTTAKLAEYCTELCTSLREEISTLSSSFQEEDISSYISSVSEETLLQNIGTITKKITLCIDVSTKLLAVTRQTTRSFDPAKLLELCEGTRKLYTELIYSTLLQHYAVNEATRLQFILSRINYNEMSAVFCPSQLATVVPEYVINFLNSDKVLGTEKEIEASDLKSKVESILNGNSTDFEDDTEQKPECSKTKNVLIDKPVFDKSLSAIMQLIMNNQKQILEASDKKFEKLTESIKGEGKNELLVKTLINNQAAANIQKYQLSEERIFDGNPLKLMHFLQYVTTRIFGDLKHPFLRWQAFMQNIKGTVKNKGEILFNKYSSDPDKAISELIRELLEVYGNRYNISCLITKNFLKHCCNFNAYKKNDLIEFKQKMEILVKDMSFIGCSEKINNTHFLEDFLSKIPPNIAQKWSKYTIKHDKMCQDIFSYQDNKLYYNIKQRKDNEIVPDYSIPCPVPEGEIGHEIKFDFDTFLSWFGKNYIVSYGHSEHEENLETEIFATFNGQNSKPAYEFTKHIPKFSNDVNTSSRRNGPENDEFKVTEGFLKGNYPLCKDFYAKKWSVEKKLVFLLKENRGCKRCTHLKPNCICDKNKEIEGYPCKKHPLSSKAGTSHNDFLHMENYNAFNRGVGQKGVNFLCREMEVGQVEYDLNVSSLHKYKTAKKLANQKLPIEQTSAMKASYDSYYMECAKNNVKNDHFLQYLPNTPLNPIFVTPAKSNFRPFLHILVSDARGLSTIATLAMIDSGSEVTLIDSFLQKQLMIKGSSKPLKIGGVNSSSIRNVEECDVILSDIKRKTNVRLNNVISINMHKRPLIPNHTIPSKTVVQGTPGLKTLPWPEKPSAHIILGMDYAYLFHNKALHDEKFVHVANTTYTMAQNTPLGTVIGGALGSPNMISRREYQYQNLSLFCNESAEVGACTFLNSCSYINENRLSQLENQNENTNINHIEFEALTVNKNKDVCKAEMKSGNDVNLEIAYEIDLLDTEKPDFKEMPIGNHDFFDAFNRQNIYKGPVTNIQENESFLQRNDKVRFDFLLPKIDKGEKKEHQCEIVDVKGTKNDELYEILCNDINQKEVCSTEILTKDSLTIPQVTRDEYLDSPAKIYSLPENHKALLEKLDPDLHECVTGVNHLSFQYLNKHSYLDPKTWTREQMFTYQNAIKHSYRGEDGRYVMKLTFNEKKKFLSSSPHKAMHMLNSITKKAKKDPVFLKKVKAYCDELKETVLSVVPENEIKNPNSHVLGWFAIQSGSDESGEPKFRLVFHAACETDGVSLNDTLCSAPEITSSLLGAAFKFREYKDIVMSDIKKCT